MPPSLHHLGYPLLASEVAARLAEAGGEEVLVASRGVASSILRALLERRPEGVAGVRLHSIETLAARIINERGSYPRVASPAERRLAMRTAVGNIDDPLLETRGIAAMLERSYRDVRDGGLTLVNFESRLAKARSLRNPTRTRLMANVWRRYEWLIEQLGAIDSADLLRRAGALVREGSAAVPPQIVAGFYDMTGAQRDFLDALVERELVSSYYVPVTEERTDPFAAALSTHFASHSSRAPQTALAATTVPAWSAAQFENRTIEIDQACAETARLLASGIHPDRIAIVARSLDPHDLNRIEVAAAAHGFLTTATVATPLLAQRIGRGVATILRLRDHNFPRSWVVDLLRDGFRSRRNVDIDQVDQETRRAGIAGGLSSTLQHAATRSALSDYLSVVGELEALAPDSALTPSNAASLLRNLAARFRLETAADLAALDAIEEVAAIFARAGRWRQRVDIATILDALEHQELEGPGSSRGAVFAGDVMRFRGRSVDHLFVVRLQDDLFPQRRLEDPLLPDSDRRALGLRMIGDGADEERMLFRLLLDGARQSIRFTWSASDGFSKSMRPSPLLKHFVLEQEPSRRAELLRDFGQAFAVRIPPSALSEGGAPRQLQLLAQSGTRSLFDGYLFADGVHEVVRARLAAILESVSPTQLEDFGECPQKFLLKHILHVRDLDDPEHELQINPRDKGSINHAILEQFYRDFTPEDLDRAFGALPQLDEVLGQKLDALVEAAFDDLDARVPPFNGTMRAIERRSTRRILRQFLALDLADLLRRNLRPVHVEYRFGKKYVDRGGANHPEPFTVALQQEGGELVTLRVDGSVDRIDRGASGYRIVDYKGGQALRHKDLADKIDRGVRLQLPLYAMAVGQFFGVPADQIIGAIKPLVSGKTKAEKFEFELGSRHQTLLDTLGLFVTSILRGTFPAFPEAKQYDACKYCPVNSSCRTRHDPVERYAVVLDGDPQTLLRGLL